MKRALLFTTFFSAVFLSQSPAYAADIADQTFTRYVNNQGEITLPEDFRLHWTHLGSWIVTDPKAPGHGFHDVYTQREAAEAYRTSGVFPDGTVLVKEIRTIRSGPKTTGIAQWADQNAVWFVMVKDDKKRFQNSHWAEGWGWALYDAKNPGVNVSKGFGESCMGCHLPAKNTDWVFVEGYPTILADNPKQ